MPPLTGEMREAWQLEKQKAESLTRIIHDAVRMLKMGDAAVIPVGKFNPDELRLHLWAYALHKNKWFDAEYDATTRVYRVKRGIPLMLREDKDALSEEEEE